MSELAALHWLIRAAAGGGTILLVAWWLMRRIESPARRQRLGEGALVAAFLVAALSLTPGWIPVRVPLPVPAPVEPPPARVEAPAETPEFVELFAPEDVFAEDVPLIEDALAVAAAAEPKQPEGWSVAGLVVAAYAGVALALLAWRLSGHLVLWCWLRRRLPVPPRVAALWREMTTGRRVRLVVSPSVRVPFSCGLWRPTVALPAGLAGSATDAELRWVLRHELRHLERHDPLSAVLFGVGQSLYFYLPWFWWLRHEVRLCQEYLADQAAVESGGDRVDYADFLAGWAAAPGLPAGVPAVAGQGSDLFRRIRMLLEKRSSLESRCPRRWLLATAAALLSLAVLLAGVGPAALADTKKGDSEKPRDADTKKDEKDRKDRKDDREKPKQDREKPKDGKEKPKDKDGMAFPDIEELLKKLPGGLDENQIQMIRRQLEAAKRQMDQAMKMGERLRPLGDRLPMRPLDGLFGRGGHESRLGVRLATPSAALAEQLDLPRAQGLVIEEVLKDSEAAAVGLKVNDILLEVGGKAVPNRPEQLVKQLEAIESNKAVEVVVLRKGKKETIKGVKLPAAKPARRDAPRDPLVRPAPARVESILNLTRTGEQFTLVSREGTRTIQLRGKLKDGKADSVSIQITDGRESKTYDSLDKVPEGTRDEVKGLLSMCEKPAPARKEKKKESGR